MKVVILNNANLLRKNAVNLNPIINMDIEPIVYTFVRSRKIIPATLQV